MQTSTPSVGTDIPPNNSGTGASAQMPVELKGWCWPGFLMPVCWSISNNVWIGLVALVGVVPYAGWLANIVMRVVLGINGNKWAWQQRRFQDSHQFKTMQRKWVVAGLIVNALLIGSVVLSAYIVASYWNRQIDSVIMPQIQQMADQAEKQAAQQAATSKSRVPVKQPAQAPLHNNKK